MSIEPTEAALTETAVDDRTTDVPDGGFAPLGDFSGGTLPDSSEMPPPPGVSGPVAHGASDTEETADEPRQAEHTGAGLFPGTTPEPVAESSPDPAGPEADQSAPSSAEANDGDGSVVFFGDGSPSATPSSWIPEEDADYIMPIEPARLLDREPAAVESGEAPWSKAELVNDADVADSADFDPDEQSDGPATGDAEVADGGAVQARVAARVLRGIARSVGRVEAFFDEADITHTTLTPLAGPIVVLAGSELGGVIEGGDTQGAGYDGSSVEWCPPEHAPLGVRIPIALVSVDDDPRHPEISELGGLTATVVSGALDLAIAFDGRVVKDIETAISTSLERLADSANRRLEEQGRRFRSITVDSLGSLRVESESV